MKVALSIVVLVLCYYSFSYGVYILKNEKNKVAAFGIFLITIVGTVIPIIELFRKL